MSDDRLDLCERWEAFVDERGWERFQTPKNLATSISIEAAELLEVFQWHDNLPAEEIRGDEETMERIREELADVLVYAIGLSVRLDVDLREAVEAKMAANEERFDEETAARIADDLDRWRR